MALRQFPKLLLGRSQFQALVGQRSWSSFCRLGDAAGDLAGGDVLVGGGGVHQDVEENFSTNSFKVYRWHDQKCAHGITFVEHALQLKLVRQAQANISLPK